MNFYASHIQHFMSDSNSKNNTSQGFENSQMVSRGCVWVGAKFSKPWQVTDNIIEVNFFPIHIQHFMSDSNSENNNS